MMIETSYCIIITTFSSKPEAVAMAKKLIASKLAACVQIAEVESFYRWEGETCQEKEFRLEIKTKRELYEKIEAFIFKNHSYETPEVLLLPILNGSKSYFRWIESSLDAG